ncbi:MAG: LicD family protein [Tannerellaceae bacterium]|jgi:lipopolysaccharide cholinephosphotransferase|nr:LicD family protein [Tannerellaceae bacterium]
MNKINFAELFPDNRHEGDTTLRQAQLVLLRMFKIIDYICRKHHIKYWMCSGTLLGAVRHKGFIPWDDDLDICMPREDFERFVKIAVEEFPSDMLLQTRETDPNYRYLPLPCKVRDKKSFVLTPGYMDEKSEKGLYIDVFTIDRYHTNPVMFRLEKAIKTYNTFICKCLDSVDFKDESFIRKILSYFHPLFHFLVLQYMKSAKKIIKRNQQLGTNCRIGHGFDTIWKRYFTYKDIFPLSELTFEDATFYAPHSPDVYLSTLYGPDYMTPLPESKRIFHAQVIKPIL